MTDMDKMMIEPCPFCGGTGHVETSRLSTLSWPIWQHTPECPVNAAQMFPNPEAAAKAGNTRAYNPDDRLREALAELTVLRSAMTQSVWHDIPGGRAKRILVAETAIERIDAALSPLPQGRG